MTTAFAVLVAVSLAVGTILSMQARTRRTPAAASVGERDAMYRTSFGFASPSSVSAIPKPRRAPTAYVASIVPFAISGIPAAIAAPHQVERLWVFSCRLFRH